MGKKKTWNYHTCIIIKTLTPYPLAKAYRDYMYTYIGQQLLVTQTDMYVHVHVPQFVLSEDKGFPNSSRPQRSTDTEGERILFR